MPVATSQGKRRYKDVWEGNATFATSLLLLTVDVYGTEAFEWDFKTLKMEIEEDFNVNVPQANFDRLMVAINLLKTDDFFKSLPDFIAWCNVLDGDRYDPRIFDPADAEEIAWGITEALIIEPPDEDEPFTDEIRSYMGAVLDQEGIINPPDILRLALRDNPDLFATVKGEFSDDPELFGAIYEFEDSKTAAINQYVKEKLAMLSVQIDQLPLRNGDAAGVVQQVIQQLGRVEKLSERHKAIKAVAGNRELRFITLD